MTSSPRSCKRLGRSIRLVSTSADPVSESSADFLQELLSRKLHTGACTEMFCDPLVFRLPQDSSCDFLLFPCPVNIVAHFQDWM